MLCYALPAALLLGLSQGAEDPAPEEFEELTITAPEPRFVAPTRRDRIGRIWAPVEINGKGPFRLVLDTGASHSAVTAKVAEALGLALDYRGNITLRGATGTVKVPAIPVESLEVGELLMQPKHLPIVPDALGGAEGVLGTDGLGDKRITIEFRRDRITIMRSRNEKAPPGFLTVPVKFMRGRLLVVDAWLGGVHTKAIIDTGGQATLGNLALRDALARRRSQSQSVPDEVTGTTLDVQIGDRISTPAVVLGDIVVRNPAMTFADFAIFGYWKMTDEPAMLIGMDVLGLIETLIIDYRRKELQVRLRRT
ncbi:MAG: retroviral-like aspartic protease family protein [Gammaproteobacteria bacterium]|nr:retroviral-like aspartic protease family protein [Gammaproteobacteria bacterium]